MDPPTRYSHDDGRLPTLVETTEPRRPARDRPFDQSRRRADGAARQLRIQRPSDAAAHFGRAGNEQDSVRDAARKPPDLPDAGEAFTCYMMAMFGIDPEQREDVQPKAERSQSPPLPLVVSAADQRLGIRQQRARRAPCSKAGWKAASAYSRPFTRDHPAHFQRRMDRLCRRKMSSRFHNNAIYIQLDLLFEFCQWALERFVVPGQTHLTLLPRDQLLRRASNRRAGSTSATW